MSAVLSKLRLHGIGEIISGMTELIVEVGGGSSLLRNLRRLDSYHIDAQKRA